MHNTSTEYKQMHNKNNIMKWQLNTYLYFFVGRLLLEPSTSSFSSFIIASFLIQMLRWIRGWVLHIPHHLRDLLWMVRAWSSVAPIFSSLLLSRAFSSSRSLLKVITYFCHTFLAWMNPTILGGYSRWPSPLLHSSLILQVVLDLRDSHEFMVSAF